MPTWLRWFFALMALCGAQPVCCSDPTSFVRPAVVAGKFYPDDPGRLSTDIDALMAKALSADMEQPVALVVPHAGYMYSGQICADAFKLASRFSFDIVIILGTNHTTPDFQGISVFDAGEFETPLGRIQVDEEITKKLVSSGEPVTAERRVHRREHSIEVILPFIQKVFSKAKIVPVIIGEPNIDMCQEFGGLLAQTLQGKKSLIIASSDLSHYPDYSDATEVDRNVLNAMTRLDPARLLAEIRNQEHRSIRNLATASCGLGPILTAISAARSLGADCGRIISYANSGDTLHGDRARVVGYASVSFCRGSRPCGEFPETRNSVQESATLTDDQKQVLLAFARDTIQKQLENGTTPVLRPDDPALLEKQGAFVTLKKNGQLRGCIGNMLPDLPLYQTVGKMAESAAFHDPRFTQLSVSELKDVKIEISVLTPYQLSAADRIRIGRDGVLLKRSGRSAVFLPQVAPEQGWDLKETLDNLCRKAGFLSDCWKQGAEIYTFQAIIFSEP